MYMAGFDWLLCHINPCRSFNAKSSLYIYIKCIWLGLIDFYAISTLVGHLMPNPLYTYILDIKDLVWLCFMAYQPVTYLGHAYFWRGDILVICRGYSQRILSHTDWVVWCVSLPPTRLHFTQGQWPKGPPTGLYEHLSVWLVAFYRCAPLNSHLLNIWRLSSQGTGDFTRIGWYFKKKLTFYFIFITLIHTHTHTHTHTYIYIYIYICMCVYIYIYIYIYTHTHTYIYIYPRPTNLDII